jgi:hypothetical protein
MGVYGAVKLIGTRKLQRGGRGAWGWGLAVGIIGCCQLVCGSCLCLQVAPGIYTVVVMCFQNVRNHLQSHAEMDEGAGTGGPGPYGT